jgi:hypothetical protein
MIQPRKILKSVVYYIMLFTVRASLHTVIYIVPEPAFMRVFQHSFIIFHIAQIDIMPLLVYVIIHSADDTLGRAYFMPVYFFEIIEIIHNLLLVI